MVFLTLMMRRSAKPRKADAKETSRKRAGRKTLDSTLAKDRVTLAWHRFDRCWSLAINRLLEQNVLPWMLRSHNMVLFHFKAEGSSAKKRMLDNLEVFDGCLLVELSLVELSSWIAVGFHAVGHRCHRKLPRLCSARRFPRRWPHHNSNVTGQTNRQLDLWHCNVIDTI